MSRSFTIVVVIGMLICATQWTRAQPRSSTDIGQIRRADRAAEQFVERFRQTLDLRKAWYGFQMAGESCTNKTAGALSESNYQRLKPSPATIKRLYLAFMNYYYLKAAFELSLVNIEANDSADSITPPGIQRAEQRSKYLWRDDEMDPRTIREVRELAAETELMARLYRKHLPRNAMRSPVWQANRDYLNRRSGDERITARKGNPAFCIPETQTVYGVGQGIFFIYLVEEQGRMKIAGFGID